MRHGRAGIVAVIGVTSRSKPICNHSRLPPPSELGPWNPVDQIGSDSLNQEVAPGNLPCFSAGRLQHELNADVSSRMTISALCYDSLPNRMGMIHQNKYTLMHELETRQGHLLQTCIFLGYLSLFA